MKRLFMGSFALLFFSASMLIFQMSCKKEANAQSNNSSTQKVAYALDITDASGVNPDVCEIWTANIDGTNRTKVLTLPSTIAINSTYSDVDISSDGSKIVFSAFGVSNGNMTVYSVNVDGTNLIAVSQTVSGDGEYIVGGGVQ